MKKSEIVKELNENRCIRMLFSIDEEFSNYIKYGIHCFNYGDDAVVGQVARCGEMDCFAMDFLGMELFEDYVEGLSKIIDMLFDYLADTENEEAFSRIFGREIRFSEENIEEEIDDLREEFINRFDNDEIDLYSVF
jgi:hypothetical protein